MGKKIKSLIFFGSLLVTFGVQSIFAAKVPQEYYSNFEIEDNWQKITETLVKIDAAAQIGASIDPSLFRILNTNFKPVFKKFPQDYSYQLVYTQCLDLTETLAKGYSNNVFQVFKNSCENPLNGILGNIAGSFTVRASAGSNPSSGPAPLTVTFDARMSVDPSNETIPKNNYYWYYRDIYGKDQLIGIGQLVNHTFDEPGVYTVHLTVRSSNKHLGVMDGTMDMKITVAPKAANLVVYANAKKLSTNTTAKLGTQEARKGIVFDGTASIPMEGRKIMSHRRSIVGNEGFTYSKQYNGAPSNITVPLNENGLYTITLTTVDNENNTTTEEFKLIISDPVAIIKQSPENGTTSTTYKFDASTSYSLTSSLKLYTWEVFNENGDKIATSQGKTLSKQFIKPGIYLVKLTVEDKVGKTNVETKEIEVGSSNPVPQFTITSTNRWAKASEFILDASSTKDYDVDNKNDSLEYNWTFSDPENIKVVSTEKNNQKIIIQADKKGKHVITLTVVDQFGKTSSIEKEINVESTLRPELTIMPNAITFNKEVSFKVESNKTIYMYNWDFGDRTLAENDRDSAKHVYSSVGIYDVKVSVTDMEGDTNSVTEKVFIGAQDFPIPAYRINSNGIALQTTATCSGEKPNEKAYLIERYQTVNIDPSISVNSNGKNSNLRFFFQRQYDQVLEQNSYSAKFNEVGCQYVTLSLEDTNNGRTGSSTIRFKVVNSLPTLKNINISFPQYNNESGIGFQENNVQNIMDDMNSDTLMVKLTAIDAVDPDGKISYFKWYYYPKDNPKKIIETRITPGDINYTYFTVPRTAGEFMFGVKMYDNDDASQASEDIIGNGPTVFFPPTNSNPDIPIVTLRSDKQSIKLGDEVTFEVLAKVMSENDDFYTSRVISYDFDGDGEWDVLSTKKDRISYVYTVANETGYVPRAAVTYKGYKGISEGNTVIVRNSVKPILSYSIAGNTVVFRDMSMGELNEREICFEKEECERGNKKFRKIHFSSEESGEDGILNNQIFQHTYAQPGKHTVVVKEKGKNGQEVQIEYVIETTNKVNNGKITKGLNFLTVPEANFSKDKKISIFASKNTHNKVGFFVEYDGTGDSCFIDTDINDDSDGDMKKDNDRDINCNEEVIRDYAKNGAPIGQTIGKLYFENNGKTVFKTFTVEFEDSELLLTDAQKAIYDDISTLINGIDENTITNYTFKYLLESLRKNLTDINQTTANVVELQNFLNENPIYLDEKQNNLLQSIFTRLKNADTVSALGGNAYERSKAEILALLPDGLSDSVKLKFNSFEEIADTLDGDAKKNELTTILNYISEHAGEYEMPQTDVQDFILPEFCNILDFYDITSSACSTMTQEQEMQQSQLQENTEPHDDEGGLPGWLKILLGVVIGGIVIVGGVIVFFAVKAKVSDQSGDEEEEE